MSQLTTISLQLPVSLANFVAKKAKANNVSKSDIIRQYILTDKSKTVWENIPEIDEPEFLSGDKYINLVDKNGKGMPMEQFLKILQNYNKKHK